METYLLIPSPFFLSFFTWGWLFMVRVLYSFCFLPFYLSSLSLCKENVSLNSSIYSISTWRVSRWMGKLLGLLWACDLLLFVHVLNFFKFKDYVWLVKNLRRNVRERKIKKKKIDTWIKSWIYRLNYLKIYTILMNFNYI